MKKLFAIIALVAFMMPAITSTAAVLFDETVITLVSVENDKDKDKDKKKSKKSGDCGDLPAKKVEEKKSDCGDSKAKADCGTPKKSCCDSKKADKE